jgi:hypothetical protein
LWCSSFSPLQFTRPHPIVASLFVLFPSLLSRRPSLCITTFSPHRRGESEWITRSRSPKHRRGENEWISLRLMDSPTFLSISRSACFGDLHASTSAHQDQQHLRKCCAAGPEKSRRPTQQDRGSANAVQQARRNPGDPHSRPETRSSDVMVYDVYTGGNLLYIMQYFQAWISTYGFHLTGILLDATFFS